MRLVPGIFVTVCCCVVLSSVSRVESQTFDSTAIVQAIQTMSTRDKLLLLAQTIMDYPDLYQDLEHSLLAALPILGYDKPPQRFFNFALPWAVHHLPDLLQNVTFKKLIQIFIEELNTPTDSPAWYLNSTNDRLKTDFYMAHLLSELNYIGMAEKMYFPLIQSFNVREYFPYNSTDRPLRQQCYDDTMTFFNRLFVGDNWALNMFDAIGKPTTGIMRGVLYFIGTYDQCQNVKAFVPINATLGKDLAETEVRFNGRYCRSTFTPPRGLIETIAGDHINNTYGVPLTISLGMCLPDSCHSDDIEGLLNLGLLGTLFNVSVDKAVCTEDLDFEGDQESHIVIGILGALVLLVLVSSMIDLLFLRSKHRVASLADLYSPAEYQDNNGYEDMPTAVGVITDKQNESDTDVKPNGEVSVISKGDMHLEDIKPKMKGHLGNMKFSRPIRRRRKGNLIDESVDSDLTDNILLDTSNDEPEGAVSKLLRSFSIFTNIPAVMNTDSKDDDIECLYGIRVITIMWIVLGNTYLYVAQSLSEVPVAVDMLDSYDLMRRFTMQAVMSASYATDTFFMISGCLITYWFLYKSEYGTGSVNIKLWLKFYLGRYWKITPPYMLVMVTYVYLYTYLGDGPIWPEAIQVADNCRTDWWKHLIYINNLIGVDGVEPQNQCMAWSWYLAVNMQFYLITPVILSLLVFSSSMGLVVTGIVAAAGIVSAGVKEAEYPGEILTSRLDNGDYWNNVFIKPWCRVAAYCVGIALGFVLQNWLHKKMNKFLAVIFWVLAVCIGVLLVYAPYTKYVDGLDPWTTTQMAVYEALGRPVWALCVAWVVYACTVGLAGPIGDFLSWKGFVPLSRLSYLVFLLHPVLMVLDVYTRRTLIHLNNFEMVYQFIGHLVVNFGAAFFAALAFDFPFRNLKRIVHGKPLTSPF